MSSFLTSPVLPWVKELDCHSSMSPPYGCTALCRLTLSVSVRNPRSRTVALPDQDGGRATDRLSRGEASLRASEWELGSITGSTRSAKRWVCVVQGGQAERSGIICDGRSRRTGPLAPPSSSTHESRATPVDYPRRVRRKQSPRPRDAVRDPRKAATRCGMLIRRLTSHGGIALTIVASTSWYHCHGCLRIDTRVAGTLQEHERGCCCERAGRSQSDAPARPHGCTTRAQVTGAENSTQGWVPRVCTWLMVQGNRI